MPSSLHINNLNARLRQAPFIWPDSRLAQIAAKPPKLLILDEITNNLDLETKEHVVQVLKAYPGAMIIISHEADFLEEIGVNAYFKISGGYASFSAR